MAMGTIIVLNGTSSSGKTTLTRVLQEKLERPYYHIAQDTFTHLTSRTHRNADFWGMTTKSISAMHHTIALFSNLGLDVIVDHIISDTPEEQTWLAEAVELLHAHPVLFVQVWCPAEELDRREQGRGDRRIGHARAQLDHMYATDIYDLSVDTYQHGVEACAEMIIRALAHPEHWTAFRTLHKRWA